MKKTLWAISVRPVIDGKPSKILTHIGFYDKEEKETKDKALDRLVKEDPYTRVHILTYLAIIFGGKTLESFNQELAKNKKRSKAKRKTVEDILVSMIGINSFKVYVSSVEDNVYCADMNFVSEKKKK
jgi:hypothetical protein